MRREIVSGIVTGDELVSHWPTLSLSPVTVPEVFAKLNSAPGTCFSKSPETFQARRQIQNQNLCNSSTVPSSQNSQFCFVN